MVQCGIIIRKSDGLLASQTDYFGSSVALMNEYIVCVCGAPYFDTHRHLTTKVLFISFRTMAYNIHSGNLSPQVGVNNAAHFGSAVGINSDLEIVVGVPWQNATYSSAGCSTCLFVLMDFRGYMDKH